MRVYTVIPIAQATTRTRRAAIHTPGCMRTSLAGDLAILKFNNEEEITRTDVNRRDVNYRKLTLEEAQALVKTAAWERTIG